MILDVRTIRIAANVFEFDKTLTDYNTSSSPATWRGNDLRLDIGVFEKDGGAPVDLRNIALIRVSAKIDRAQNAPYVLGPSITDVSQMLISKEDWQAGTAYNARVEFSGTEMDINPGTADSIDLYLTITAITKAGKEITLEAGTLTVHEDWNADVTYVSGTYRWDAQLGPIWWDGAGVINATGAPVDGHAKPALDEAFDVPAVSLGGMFLHGGLGMPVWWDGSALVNCMGMPVDGNPKAALNPVYVRPIYPGTGSMEFDFALGIPIWWGGLGWVNASRAAV